MFKYPVETPLAGAAAAGGGRSAAGARQGQAVRAAPRGSRRQPGGEKSSKPQTETPFEFGGPS